MRIEVSNLCLADGEKKILDDVSFEFDKGILAIIGPNGSGKTSLLECLSGERVPSSGNITVNGTMRFLGYRSEIVAGTDAASMVMASCGKDRETAVKALRRIGSGDIAGKAVEDLSRWEVRSVSLAGCVASEPDILMMDEPADGMDVRRELETFDMLEREARDNELSVIAAVRDINVASKYASRVLVMNAGKVYGFGTPAEAITEEMLNEVFGVEVLMKKSPKGNPVVEILSSKTCRCKRFGRKGTHLVPMDLL